MCGKAGKGVAPLVVGGDRTAIESVPWHAAVYNENNTFVCGGTLVSRCSVVTGKCYLRNYHSRGTTNRATTEELPEHARKKK